MTDSPRQLIAWTIAVVVATVALVAALYAARDALVIIYLAALVAIGFGPVVRAIERQQAIPIGTRRLPRWLAILIVYFAIVGVAAGAVALVVPPLVAQAQELWSNLPRYLDRAQSFLLNRGVINHRLTLEEVMRSVPGNSASAVGTVASVVGKVTQGILAVITILILAFYFLIEANTLIATIARLFPQPSRLRVVRAGSQISSKVSAWMIGQLILGGTIGASSAVGLYLLGVPYFYVLALVSAVGELIPVVGPILAAIPATAAAFSVSPHTALYVLIFFVVQQQLENNLLVPKIMKRQIGISSAAIIVALLIGGSLFGVLGAVLALPSVAILQVLAQALLEEPDAPGNNGG